MFPIMDNDVIPSPISALLATYSRQSFQLVEGGMIIIVLSSIFSLPSSSLPDQSAFATFPGENGKIAFVRYIGNQEIYIMNSNGSGQINISTERHDDGYPDWSPDGTRIAFASTRPGNFLNWGIWVMNADGSEPRMLIDTETNELDPSWSPDGTKIAFVTDRDGNNEIYFMNADGSRQTRLTNTPNQEGTPSWSPDGTKIAFTSRDDIYAINADDGSDRTNLSNNPESDGSPDWGTAELEEDTTPPTIIVPEGIIVDATSANGGTVVNYNVTANDNVDGTANLRKMVLL
jgi:dipeptidyl aminopeptidase/acylaminoacyl peptidase